MLEPVVELKLEFPAGGKGKLEATTSRVRASK